MGNRVIGKKIRSFILKMDYGFVVPLLARFPTRAAWILFAVRGFVHGLLGYDWRCFAMGKWYVWPGTYMAMKTIRPEAGVLEWSWFTIKRFVNYSLEEWEACLFNKPEAMKRIYANSHIHGLSRLKKIHEGKKGLVLVSVHWGSFCMGMSLLGMPNLDMPNLDMHGVKTHVLNTAIIENKCIHPQVRFFLKNKYKAMERLMNGRMPYFEFEMDFLYKALTRGETVILLVDTQGSKSTVFLPFLGRLFRVPLGPWHMARNTGSVLGAFVCERIGIEKYRIICNELQTDIDDNPEKALKPLYSFLERYMRDAPEKWLAAEHIVNYRQQS